MKSLKTLALLSLLAATCAEAGVMKAGRWEIATEFLAASGPGARTDLPKQPVVLHACLGQAFVDKENYSNPGFAMQRTTRQNFECKVDSQQGDASHMQWRYSCTRPDGMTLSNDSDSQIAPELLVQQASEKILKDGTLWSEASVRVTGRYLGAECQADDRKVDR